MSSRSSPMPDLAYDSYSSLRHQNLLRRQISEQNRIKNSQISNRENVHEKLIELRQDPKDFVTLQNETYGLKPYENEALLFWALLALLITLVGINSALTFALFGTLRIGAGMESIEFFPSLLKFYGVTDLDSLTPLEGLIESFENEGMEISGGDEGGSLSLKGDNLRVDLDRTGINISNAREFVVMDPNGRQIFSTSTPSLDLPNGVKDLKVKIAKVNRVTSPINSSLELASSSFTYLKGSEGTKIQGKEILFSADRDIYLKSLSGNLVLSGERGIHLKSDSLPLVTEQGVIRNFYTMRTEGKKEGQTKLCICMPSGKLFRIYIPINNHKAGKKIITCNSALNPCSSD